MLSLTIVVADNTRLKVMEAKIKKLFNLFEEVKETQCTD